MGHSNELSAKTIGDTEGFAISERRSSNGSAEWSVADIEWTLNDISLDVEPYRYKIYGSENSFGSPIAIPSGDLVASYAKTMDPEDIVEDAEKLFSIATEDIGGEIHHRFSMLGEGLIFFIITVVDRDGNERVFSPEIQINLAPADPSGVNFCTGNTCPNGADPDDPCCVA